MPIDRGDVQRSLLSLELNLLRILNVQSSSPLSETRFMQSLELSIRLIALFETSI